MGQQTDVYWDTLQHGDWTLHFAATDTGLCCISLPNETLDTLRQWLTRHVSGANPIHDPEGLRPYVEQVAEYLEGRRTEFSLPLDLRGTPFQVSVWRTLLTIPFGDTRSYSQIAEGIGQPSAVRAVGAANGANPIPIVIPCHRVIGKSGKLTGYRGGVEMKAELLGLEGLMSARDWGSH
ncbi:methylated-DNA--[protein]-cysteine S-methyltransferase [Alicyclobacillus sp. ALC3]|uniref:methylated-DNA--[protein]-cysteine S-methyltransferase n=1 Tax=Alicyclobacillus sp. ALC3 TaxID=2796143 RepID=UPI002377DF60|nr:methylated-DNA--[protein]-cysteine S-methyltransferase [Alicyclobacillus sp. ALC3]WDL98541.1 methylated-DNA--[protein]-cysteine S-methyltransferase [Alicyclobacillus sp. ALC3]